MDGSTHAWAVTGTQALKQLDATAAGLSPATVRRRLGQFGPNAQPRTSVRSAWHIAGHQLRSLVVMLLVLGSALSFVFGDITEGLAILAVIVLNGIIGFSTELRAVRSMEALRSLAKTEAMVRRSAILTRVPAESLVPGDVLVVEAGQVVAADARLLEASRLSVDESTLTGESVPVDKDIAPLAAKTPLAERTNMLWAGTAITRGTGEAVVVATGTATELGRITALVERADTAATPLERRLDRMSRALVWASLLAVALVALAGFAAGRDSRWVLETAIALAVAAVPEGLPIVATLALARGMWRMAQRHALVRALPVVETLGATNLILTDKTGTLTENRMTVVVAAGIDREVTLPRSQEAAADPWLKQLLSTAALCTTAELREDGSAIGDPMEVALLRAARAEGIAASEMLADKPQLREEAFDPALKMMATYHRIPDGVLTAVKGAAEAVLGACTHEHSQGGPQPLSASRRAALLRLADTLGARGLRVLAVASKHETALQSQPYENLTLLGLLGLLDPPRIEVRPAIAACQRAGIRVVMVTGDHAATARNVGQAVGITSTSVVTGDLIRNPALASEAERAALLQANIIARATPEQKLWLLMMHRATGTIVAMLGDGVNDAPALRQADIGVAMGQRGTQVAREAAAMVLQDDDFHSIVAAIEQGRVIFGNIRKFVVYLLSCNLSEILVVGLTSITSSVPALMPLHILFLNLVTDVFPALALGVGHGQKDVLRRPPRPPDEPFLRPYEWRWIGAYAVGLSTLVLAAFHCAHGILGLSDPQAVAVCLATLALSQTLHVFNMADPHASMFRNEVTTNGWIWGAVTLCSALVGAAIHAPALAHLLSLRNPGWAGWVLALGLSVLVPVGGRLAHALKTCRRQGTG